MPAGHSWSALPHCGPGSAASTANRYWAYVQGGCPLRYGRVPLPVPWSTAAEGTTWVRRRPTRCDCRPARGYRSAVRASASSPRGIVRSPRWASATASAFTLNLPIFGETVVDQRPRLGQGSVHHEQRPGRAGRQPRARCSALARPSASTATSTAQRRKLLVPPFHGKRMAGYEAHRRRRGDARDRDLARGRGVRNAAADDAHHPQRDPAYGVRRRGQRVRANCANCCRRWFRWRRGWR